MSVQSISKFLWLLLAVTLPFFGAEYMRIPVGPFDLAPPMFPMAFLLIWGIISRLLPAKDASGHAMEKGLSRLYLSTFVFFLIHLASSIISVDMEAASEEIVKLMIGIFSLWTVLSQFPKEEKFAELFWLTALWASAILLIYPVYKYAFVFHSEFLGTNLSMHTKIGKNVLSWYLSMIFPFALCHFCLSSKKMASVVPTAILAISFLYVSSRGAWSSVAIGLILGLSYITLQSFRINSSAGFRMALRLFTGLFLCLGIGLLLLSRVIDLSEMYLRFLYIFDPQVTSELQSYDARMLLIKESWQGFLSSPYFGVGLANMSFFTTRITHDDYMGILLELGLVGISSFALIFLSAAAQMHLNFRRLSWLSGAGWIGFATFLASLLFINIYTSIHFWIFLGLFVVTVEADRARDLEIQRQEEWARGSAAQREPQPVLVEA